MDNFKDLKIESPKNFEQKTICCFVLDTSESMLGDPIAELTEGLRLFIQDIEGNTSLKNKLEVAIVNFNSEAEVLKSPSLVQNFEIPSFHPRGTTKLVDGVQLAISTVEERKNWYKETGQPYLRPWIILITDGAPDEDQDINALQETIEKDTRGKKYVFLAIGVKDADKNVLSQISGYYSSPKNKEEWEKLPPMEIGQAKFSKFFKWVSASMDIIGHSHDGDKVNLPSTDDWNNGFRI